MSPLFDAFVFQFWQRVWFEALKRMSIFEAFQGASVTPDPPDAVIARFGMLRRSRAASRIRTTARPLTLIIIKIGSGFS
jgi:hypothetical protein